MSSNPNRNNLPTPAEWSGAFATTLITVGVLPIINDLLKTQSFAYDPLPGLVLAGLGALEIVRYRLRTRLPNAVEQFNTGAVNGIAGTSSVIFMTEGINQLATRPIAGLLILAVGGAIALETMRHLGD